MKLLLIIPLFICSCVTQKFVATNTKQVKVLKVTRSLHTKTAVLIDQNSSKDTCYLLGGSYRPGSSWTLAADTLHWKVINGRKYYRAKLIKS